MYSHYSKIDTIFLTFATVLHSCCLLPRETLLAWCISAVLRRIRIQKATAVAPLAGGALLTWSASLRDAVVVAPAVQCGVYREEHVLAAFAGLFAFLVVTCVILFVMMRSLLPIHPDGTSCI